MADQQEPDTDASTDAVADGEGDEKKGKMGLVLILLAALLLPAAGGAWLVMTRYAQVAQAARALALVFGDDPSEKDEAEPLEFGEFMQLDNLIVNPSGTDGTRYLMVTIGLESSSPEALAEIQLKDIVVRDTVLKVLGAQTVSSLGKMETRTQLKHDLKGAINTFLKEGEVNRLYFTQFVLQ